MVIPWFALGLSALGSAVLAALGRVKYGADYALASRYVTFSIWLTIALIALGAIIGTQLIRARSSFWPRLSLVAACAILILSFLLPYRVAAANTRFFLRSWSQKDRLARASGSLQFRHRYRRSHQEDRLPGRYDSNSAKCRCPGSAEIAAPAPAAHQSRQRSSPGVADGKEAIGGR